MKHLSKLFDTIIAAFQTTSEGIVIVSMRQPDHPLVYVNQAFYNITGYTEEETIGRNCRFLQGPETDQNELDRIRTSIREGKRCLVELVNYRKDGTKFLNRLSIEPVRDGDGDVEFFVGIQSDVTELRETQRQVVQLDALAVTMRTANDIAINAFSALRYFRNKVHGGESLTPGDIELFDQTINDAVERLRAVESAKRFETKIEGHAETLDFGS